MTADFRVRPFDTVRAHVSVLNEILEQANFDSLLYLSSTRVYARSLSTKESEALPVFVEDTSDLYNISKLMGESLCLASGRNGVRVARLSNVVGTGMGADNLVGQLISDALAGKIVLKTHPNSEKDYIFIDDAISMLMSIALEGNACLYNVASGKQMEHAEWLSALNKYTGCEIEVDEKAPFQSFPAIDIERLKKEFKFEPTPLPTVIPKLIKNLNTFN